MKRKVTTYTIHLLLLWVGMLAYGFSMAQSGSFGNTFIHSGGEMVIFGAHNFQNGGSGILAGTVGTQRQPIVGVLSFAPSGTWVNAADSQHVDGYVRSYKPGPFTFPIGDNGEYYPAAISAASLTQPTTAAYYAVNPSVAITSILGGGNYPVLPPTGPFPTSSMGPGVIAVDTTGYWDIDGATSANITLTWDADKNISGLTASVSAVRIVGWNGTEWELIPSAPDATSILGGSSDLTQGSVTTLNAIVPSSYTVYALAIGCMADTLPPVVSEDTLYIYCPDSVTDLATITGMNLPAGTILSFHSDSIATVANEMDTLLVGPGIYYAADKDTANLCYSPTTAIYVIMGNDTIAPVIAGCPTDITVSNDSGSCTANVTWAVPTATDNCGGPVTVTASHNPGDLFPVGTTTVQYVFTDSAGNADTCSFVVTVTNNEGLAIACPADITVDHMINTCYRQVYFPDIIATNICDSAATVTVTTDYPSGFLFPVGTTTVTVTATDVFGNDTTCSFNVIVRDVQAPQINLCPMNVTLEANAGQCSAVATWIEPTVFENCPGVTLTSNFASGSSFPIGVTTVTYIATDAGGLADTCMFTVTVLDTEAPVIAGCLADTMVPAVAGQCSAPVSWTVPTATDNCTLDTLVSTHNPGDVFPIGTTTVTYTATDSSGNVSTCSFNVTVVDGEAPVVANCPANITASNDSAQCAAAVTWTAPTATDNCSGTVTVTSTHNPGDLFPVGVTTVQYIFTDSTGNADTCSFTVTVTDTQAPVAAACPTDIVVDNAFNICGAVVNWLAPVFTDNCSDITVTASHVSGTTFPVGVTTVTYIATDAAGNADSCSFTVTVNDTQVPVINGCPQNITVGNTAGQCGATVTWTVPTAFDNCPGVTLTSSHTSGATFASGTTTVTYVATDAAGNADTCSFTVTVTDTEAPMLIACPTNISVSNDAGQCGAAVTWTAPTATDNCGIESITSSHNSGAMFPVGTTTVTYTATDSAGNTVTCTFDVTVTDTETPVFAACPTDITVTNLAGQCEAIATWTAPTATDNCSGVTLTSSHTSGAGFPVGTTTVTYIATDAAGNMDTCSFTVTVTDTEAPVASNCPTDITVNAAFNTCGAPVSWTAPTFTDNCSGVTVTASHTSGIEFPVGTTTVTYVATDAAGNTDSCSFTVTVTDTQIPVIVGCPIDVTLSNDEGTCGADYNWVTPTALDNCPGVVLTATHAPGSVFAVGTTTVTYTVTDASGNVDSCSFTVTVTDTEAPVTVACPTDITVSNTAGQCNAIVTWTAPTATDNCSGTITTVSSHAPGDTFPIGTTTVIYTFTDSAGNSVDCMFDVTVTDTEAPTVVDCPGNIVSCDAVVTWTAPTATDNCAGAVTVTASHQPGTSFPVGTTTVTYTFTDAAGNTDSCSFTVTISTPVLTPVVANVTCNGANNGTATVIVQSGVGPFTFNWNPDGTDSLLTDLAPGVYTVTVTDANGCKDSVSMTVTEPVVLSTTIESVHDALCGVSDGYIQVITEGGTPEYSFSWSNGQTTQNLYGVPEGAYSLVTTDANGCTDTLNVSVICTFGKIPQLVTPNGDGHNDTWVIPGIEGYKEGVVEIYNRWGNLVYKASPYLNDWAGYSENATDVGQGMLPAGTYFYVITLSKGEKALSGYIELQY